MSTLNVAVADEKKNMQSLLKGMEFIGTARSSDEAYSMINGNAGSDVILVYVKRASGDTEPLCRLHHAEHEDAMQRNQQRLFSWREEAPLPGLYLHLS